jgi:hypothetical protein
MRRKPNRDLENFNAKRREARLRQEDGRTQTARRRRAIERLIRAELAARGRVISILDEMAITALTRAQVQLELADAIASRGGHVDDEALSRWANVAARARTELGITPAALKPKASLQQHLQGRAGSVVDVEQVP